MTNISPTNRLDAMDVLRLSDDDAAHWLKDKPSFDRPILSTNPELELHRVASFAFSRRRSKRVRQAVARYGSHIRSLRNLFHKGSKIERLAVLSNPYIGPRDEGGVFSSDLVLSKSDAEAILKNYQTDAREFAVFVNNPHINREWLSTRIRSWMEAEDFNINGLLFLVHHLVENPIINSRRNETFMDGWSEYSYNQLNFALANLLQTAPVTKDWAYVLSRMLKNLYLSFVPDFEFDLIDRWQDPEPTDNGEHSTFPFLREQITRHLIAPNHRAEVKEKYSVEHDDAAVRKGLYSSLQPYELFKGISRVRNFYYPSFRHLDDIELSEPQMQLVEFCKKCFERDKNDFVEGLILNENFWKTKQDREFLNDIAWRLADDPHSSMHMPNLYNAREQYHLEHNPSFFKDYETVDTLYEDTIDGKLSKLQEELSKLQEEIKSQSIKEHADELRAHLESIIEEMQSQIRHLSDNVSEKSEELARMIAQGSLAQRFQTLESRTRYLGGLMWLLVIVAVVIGYLNLS